MTTEHTGYAETCKERSSFSNGIALGIVGTLGVLLLGFGILMVGIGLGEETIRREAIEKGHATHELLLDGKTAFTWLPVGDVKVEKKKEEKP